MIPEMAYERIGAPFAGRVGAAQQLGPWQRFVLAMAGAAGLAVGCGDSADLPSATQANRIEKYATVEVPPELPASWTLPAEGVRLAASGDRAGLAFVVGEEALTVTLPVPQGAVGAGRVALRVLCDGAFAFRVVIGEHESTLVRGTDTRRRWKELQFPLPAPLPKEALATPMRIERVSAERPVLLEAIKCLP
jgi:hypothetical protein